jgi:hypothetical protein
VEVVQCEQRLGITEPKETHMGNGHRGIARLVLAAASAAASITMAALPAAAASTPKAEISINPAEGALTVTFTARSTGFPSAVVSYEWTFGDGTMATTSSHEVVHRYPSAGDFRPSVTEVDARGDQARASGTIGVFQCPQGAPDCTETLKNTEGVRLLTASGPIGAAAPASLNLFAGPFKIYHCQVESVPTVALTDSGFTGNLTVTLGYTTKHPSQAKTTCFASMVPFVDAAGQTVTSGALPMCQSVQTAPCVESEDISGSSVNKVLLVPPGDPKVGAP